MSILLALALVTAVVAPALAFGALKPATVVPDAFESDDTTTTAKANGTLTDHTVTSLTDMDFSYIDVTATDTPIVVENTWDGRLGRHDADRVLVRRQQRSHHCDRSEWPRRSGIRSRPDASMVRAPESGTLLHRQPSDAPRRCGGRPVSASPGTEPGHPCGRSQPILHRRRGLTQDLAHDGLYVRRVHRRVRRCRRIHTAGMHRRDGTRIRGRAGRRRVGGKNGPMFETFPILLTEPDSLQPGDRGGDTAPERSAPLDDRPPSRSTSWAGRRQ